MGNLISGNTNQGILLDTVGVATIQAEPIDPDSFIKMADEQLYLAKNTGRNRVCG